MRLVKEIDPEGVERRKGRKLKRRTYFCNVRDIFFNRVMIIIFFFAPVGL